MSTAPLSELWEPNDVDPVLPLEAEAEPRTMGTPRKTVHEVNDKYVGTWGPPGAKRKNAHRVIYVCSLQFLVVAGMVSASEVFPPRKSSL